MVSPLSVRQIELKRKCAELAAMRDLEQAKAEAAQANAEARAVERGLQGVPLVPGPEFLGGSLLLFKPFYSIFW